MPAHISIPHLCLDPLELELHVIMKRRMGGWEQNLDPLQQILFTEPFLVLFLKDLYKYEVVSNLILENRPGILRKVKDWDVA